MIKALGISLLAVFAPIKAVLATALVLVLADLIVGILAARKRGEPITSAGIRRTVGKILVYETAIMLGYLAQTHLMGDIIPVVKIISGLIGAVELKSCLENLDTVSGGSLFKSLIAKLGSRNDSDV